MELYLYRTSAKREDAYALLAYAVHRRWSLDPLPAIACTEQGKPFFPQFPNCQFNLSHSGTFALCVLDELPVGADMETIRPHHPRLAQRICSAGELAWLADQPDKNSALCQLWVGKEALAKYHGTGLTAPLRSLCPPLPPAVEQDGLLFHRFATPEYCLCVCGHTSAEPVHLVSMEEISR